jgi:hypothetical protein
VAPLPALRIVGVPAHHVPKEVVVVRINPGHGLSIGVVQVRHIYRESYGLGEAPARTRRCLPPSRRARSTGDGRGSPLVAVCGAVRGRGEEGGHSCPVGLAGGYLDDHEQAGLVNQPELEHLQLDQPGLRMVDPDRRGLEVTDRVVRPPLPELRAGLG